MRKAMLLLLVFYVSISMRENAQAMEDDRYMDDLDWYKFNTNRAANPSLSDQSRWEASQLAAQNAEEMDRKMNNWYRSYNLPYRSNSNPVTAHDIYSAGTGEINGQPGSYLPPLSSNLTTVGGLWNDLNHSGNYQNTSSANYTYSPNTSYKPQQTYNPITYKTEETPKKGEARSGERVKDDLHLRELAREHRELVERLRAEGKVQRNGSINISIEGMAKYRNIHYQGNEAWHRYFKKYGEEPEKSLSFFACPALPGNFYTLVGQTW